MNNRYNELEFQIEGYFSNLEELKSRRNLWNTFSKQTIFNCLNTINQRYSKLGWYVQKYAGQDQLECILWDMGKNPSEFSNANFQFTQIGGQLLFSQNLNGFIEVGMYYPSIENLTRTKYEHLDQFHPDDLNEDLILSLAEKFLKNIKKWVLEKE